MMSVLSKEDIVQVALGLKFKCPICKKLLPINKKYLVVVRTI